MTKKMMNYLLAGALSLALLTGCDSPAPEVPAPVAPPVPEQTQVQPSEPAPAPPVGDAPVTLLPHPVTEEPVVQPAEPTPAEPVPVPPTPVELPEVKPVAPTPAPVEPAPLTPPAPAPADPVPVGSVLLSVNPEIEVEYDSRGLVIEIEGRNDEGKKIVASYADFRGKSCEEVVKELVERIYDSGYFQQSVGGQPKNVVVKLEAGSAYPGDAFLEGVARGVQEAVTALKVQSQAVTVSDKDLDDRGYIGLEKAKELVLKQLRLKEADFTNREYELDDGVYELEFTCDGVEYEFEVDARTGKVLEADYERNDDWNFRREDKKDNTPAKPSKSDYISLEDARNKALKHLDISKNAKFYDTDQDLDDGIYELEFSYDGVEYEVDVDARTGEVLSVKKEKDDDWRGDTPAKSDTIDADTAWANALKYLDLDKDAKLYDKEIDRENGRFELSFSCDGTEYDVDVDADTGEVLSVKKEKDDDWRGDTPAKPDTPAKSDTIDADTAWANALKHLGLDKNAKLYDKEIDRENGRFELSFSCDGMEYEVDVDAATGKVLKAEKERDD